MWGRLPCGAGGVEAVLGLAEPPGEPVLPPHPASNIDSKKKVATMVTVRDVLGTMLISRDSAGVFYVAMRLTKQKFRQEFA